MKTKVHIPNEESVLKWIDKGLLPPEMLPNEEWTKDVDCFCVVEDRNGQRVELADLGVSLAKQCFEEYLKKIS